MSSPTLPPEIVRVLGDLRGAAFGGNVPVGGPGLVVCFLGRLSGASMRRMNCTSPPEAGLPLWFLAAGAGRDHRVCVVILTRVVLRLVRPLNRGRLRSC